MQVCERGRARHDGGQAMPLLVIAVALVALVAVATSSVARRVVDRDRAQAAADAVALAMVAQGGVVADRVAAANGASVLRRTVRRLDGGADGGPAGSGSIEVVVVVRVGGVLATARATNAP
jgi:hypothetical protein